MAKRPKIRHLAIITLDPERLAKFYEQTFEMTRLPAKGGAVEFRVEKAGIVHAGVGKASFDLKALEENIRAFADAVSKAKPAGAKGNYIKKVSVTSTMGPGLKLDITSLTA
jgi:hypothetical protein